MRDRKIERMRYEILQLKENLEEKNFQNERTNVVVVPSTSSPTKENARSLENAEKAEPNSEYLSLKVQLDSLYAFAKAEKEMVDIPQNNGSPSYDEEFSALQQKLIDLKNEMAAKNALPSDYETLNARFKNYNRAVYFENNAKLLNTKGVQVVEEIFSLLNMYENLDVVIKGFASDKGNPRYNENLSMQRTEAVKKALVRRGIHPTRVLTQYHGIDYNASNAESARRVEIAMLVRK